MQHTRTAGPRRPSADLHQAAGVRGDECDDAGGARQLVICHCNGDLGLPGRERAAEAAAKVGPRKVAYLCARSLQQPAWRIGDTKLTQHVARVVVRNNATVVSARDVSTVLIKKRGELPHVVRLAPDQLWQVVLSIVAQEPEGTTTGRSGAKARANVFATRLAAERCPAL